MKESQNTRPSEADLEQYEEIALAMAQSEIYAALTAAKLQQSTVAEIMGRPKSFLSKIMSGGHNLTIRTMARVLAACGFELRFGRTPVVSQWGEVTLTADEPEGLISKTTKVPVDPKETSSAGALVPLAA